MSSFPEQLDDCYNQTYLNGINTKEIGEKNYAFVIMFGKYYTSL